MTSSNSRAGGLVAGSLLIGLGVLFLLGQLFDFGSWRYLWPTIVIAVGGVFFAGMFAGGKSAAGLAIPGSLITMIGLILLFQNATGRWESWSYGWTLILVGAGLGVSIMGWRREDPAQRQSGLRAAGVGAVLFVIFGSLFELPGGLFGARGAGQIVFPVLLIGLGLYLVARRSGLWPGGQPRAEAAPPPATPAPGETPKL